MIFIANSTIPTTSDYCPGGDQEYLHEKVKN